MELINQIFYYFVLFVPILFWLAYRFGYREHIDKISDVIMKKIELDSHAYTISKFFYIMLYVAFVFYVTVGAIGAFFEIFIGFQSMYSVEDKSYVIKVLQAGFEIAILVTLLSFIRVSDLMKPNITFAKNIYKTQSNPRQVIKSLYLKYFGMHILYVWIILNLYFVVFQEFVILDGAKSIVLFHF